MSIITLFRTEQVQYITQIVYEVKDNACGLR